MEDRALTVVDSPLALPDAATFSAQLRVIREFQAVARSQMVEGQDYGIIPGTQKPTLLKPGAEKIAKLLGLSDQYEILDKVEDWNRPLFRYVIKCRLVSLKHGVTVSEGLGECNSMEAKYRWRDSKRKCPQCGAEAIVKGKKEYGGGWICFKKTGGCGLKWADGAAVIEGQKVGRVENDDIYSQVNTILKMAKKRALVDASLSAGRLSQVFTQDIEDMRGETDEEHTGGAPAPVSPTSPGPEQEGKPALSSQPGAPPIPAMATLGELLTWARDTHGQDSRAVRSALLMAGLRRADGQEAKSVLDLVPNTPEAVRAAYELLLTAWSPGQTKLPEEAKA